MRKKTNVILICLLTLVVLSTSFIIARQYQRIVNLENSLPFLPYGERIKYFDLLDKEDKRIDKTFIEGNKISLIYVFERPCSPCNKNIMFWNKIASKFKDQVKVCGVIPEDFQDFFNQVERLRVNFRLFYPENLSKFLNELRIRTNTAQTILYSKGVRHLIPGDLESEDIFLLMEKIKEEIKKNG